MSRADGASVTTGATRQSRVPEGTGAKNQRNRRWS